jgi:hypothetical protein
VHGDLAAQLAQLGLVALAYLILTGIGAATPTNVTLLVLVIFGVD